MKRRSWALSLVLIGGGACSDTPVTEDASVADVGSLDAAADAGSLPDDVGSTDAAEMALVGLEFFARMIGLWSGPATDTRLGTFPLKNMDVRAASDSVLFGRVDLDEDNSLRFAFAFEVHGGEPVLVFRNGGLFLGLSRDTRTVLVDVTGNTYRFCALEGGCDYVESTFEFTSETSLQMRVMVQGVMHEIWTPTRVETRELSEDFPAQADLPGDSAFPPMPTAAIRVRWNNALAADTDVWAILSETSCIPSGACQFSRWIKTRATAGATEATIELDQIHSGPYVVLALVDLDNNLATAQSPTRGDLISVPSPSVMIAAQGTTNLDVLAAFAVP